MIAAMLPSGFLNASASTLVPVVPGAKRVGEPRHLCREAGVAYASACLVTDFDCWHEEQGPVSVEAVLGVLRENAATANRVLASAVRRLDPARPSDCADALAFAVLTPPTRVPARTRGRLALLTAKGRA